MLRSCGPGARPWVSSISLPRDRMRPERSQKTRSRANSALVTATRSPTGLVSRLSVRLACHPAKT